MADRVLWRECWSKELCVRYPCPTLPNPGRKCDYCEGVTACVSIIQRGISFFVRIEIQGNAEEYALADAQLTYVYGIGTVKLGISSIEMDGNQLVAVKLKVELCIGFDIAGYDFEECWTVFETRVRFAYQGALRVPGDITSAKLEAEEQLADTLRTLGVVGIYATESDRDCGCTPA